MADRSVNYVRYSDAIETKQPDEDALIAKVVSSMSAVARKVAQTHDHAKRAEHSKSHGALKGSLDVYAGLPEHLRQGLFAVPAAYPVVVRLSSAPGDILKDSISTPKGMAIKVIGVPGPKLLPGRESDVTQDFLLVNGPAIPFGEVAAYWKQQKLIAKHFDDPEAFRQVVSNVAQGVNKVLLAVGAGENPSLSGLGQPARHILGETFYSMAAIRFGQYVAKISVAPISENLQPLIGKAVDPGGRANLQRELVEEFFQQNEAEYELRAQLCTNLKSMPVEDASVVWPEEESFYQPVAKLTLPKQDAGGAARRAYVEGVLSFNPWHCIAEHRPLGSIMRVRKNAYEASMRFRHLTNAQPVVEPRKAGDIPD